MKIIKHIILGFCLLIFGFSILAAGCGQQGATTTTTSTTTTTIPWTGHVVLAEVFSAEWCEHCPFAVLPMEQHAEEYGTSKLVIAEYHIQDPGYSTDETDNRFYNFYGGSGIPLIIFDGIVIKLGAGHDYEPTINERLSIQNTISIEAQASLADQKVTVSGNISNESNSDLSNLTVNFLIMRDYGTDTHHYIVRDIMSQNITNLASGENITVIATSETLSETASLSAVVFVQKIDKEVLQAFYRSL